MKKKKRVVIALVLLLAAVVIIAAATATYAIWTETAGEFKYLAQDVEDENPSLKYQIYVPVDETGLPVEGSIDVLGREYTAPPYAVGNIAGYMLAGWDGGASVTKLEIPNAYSMKINGEATEFPVVGAGYSDKIDVKFAFRGNRTITDIVVSGSVQYINGAEYSYMENLTSLTFRGTGNIAIGDYAFGSCLKLSTISRGMRTIVGDEAKIFFKN